MFSSVVLAASELLSLEPPTAMLSSLLNALLGTSVMVSTTLDHGTAKQGEPYWMETIKHQGIAAYNSNPGAYQVFRSVKDFGAKGDGITDDTVAINTAISSGNRCGLGTCDSSTTTPAVVYFPQGTYLVSAPLIAYYYSVMMGDARHPPTLLAAPNFVGIAVIDANPYLGGDRQFYTPQNNFFRSVRNLVIDLRQMPPSSGTGIHWQVSQATSLMNIVVHMSTANGTQQQGMFMENGSGGFMGDLVFNGGKFGMFLGNQQYTVRNITINNAATGIFAVWNWGWTFQGVTLNNCGVGFDIATGDGRAGQTVGAEAITDAAVTDCPIFIRTSTHSEHKLAGSIVLNNVKLVNVPVAVGVLNGTTILHGGTRTIESWIQGNIYHGLNPKGVFTQADVPARYTPSSLLDHSGGIFGKSHPQYADYSASQVVSVRCEGATGDGHTDDTEAINAILCKYANRKIIFFDAGTYIVSSTILVPPGSRIVGEAWSVIAGKGPWFQDQHHPQVVVQVGEEGSVGVAEISDIVFTTVGPAAGAIVVEWNIRDPHGHKGAAGMWDSHIRLGGASGTELEGDKCSAKGPTNTADCFAAFMALHLTRHSTAYLEGTWVWLADHDLDRGNSGQISIYSGRGILSESQGPVWLIGTASEHHTLYQYNLVHARDHYIGLLQVETPYYQPVPAPPYPFRIDKRYADPWYPHDLTSSWGLNIARSHNIIVFGAGLYSFFSNYSQDCIPTRDCQTQMVNIDKHSSVRIYSLSTVASTAMISIDGVPVVHEKDNFNGFASTVSLWSQHRE